MKKIPVWIYIFWAMFLFATIYLGEIKNFYYHLPYWDNLLHISSGAMIVVTGIYFIEIINKRKKLKINFRYLVISAFAFAITCGVVWEIYEYIADGVLGLNMQKFASEGGALMLGREALKDTMQDLIADTVGSFCASLIVYKIKANKN